MQTNYQTNYCLFISFGGLLLDRTCLVFARLRQKDRLDITRRTGLDRFVWPASARSKTLAQRFDEPLVVCRPLDPVPLPETLVEGVPAAALLLLDQAALLWRRGGGG